MEDRCMPICVTEKQYRLIEEYAHRRGMLNAGQALEDMLDARSPQMG